MSVNGRNVPNYVQSEGHARFRVNFKPKEAAVHTLSVKFNGEPVPGQRLLTSLYSWPHARSSVDVCVCACVCVGAVI